MAKTPITPIDKPLAGITSLDQSEPNPLAGAETCLKTLNAFEPPSHPSFARMGEFELKEKLGKGGMGIVFKSYHPRLQKTVAIKVLKDAGDLSIDDLNRFRGEALLAANLQNANIVQVFDILQENGTPFIVMEYVDGGSLEQKLGGNPQPPRVAVEWLETIARAVGYAHGHQIIHRDLKPANILVTCEGVLKITDFGLGKRLDSTKNETRSGMIIGTPHYMAPEQAAGNVQLIGPAADIHALGAILYEMLTGRPPFQGVTLVEILEQVMNAEPPAPSRLVARIPKELSTICLKCLSKAPARRYPTAMALAEDLRRWQDGEAIVARPPGRIERLSRTIRKHPLASALAVFAALLGLLATVTLFLMIDRRAKEFERAREAENASRAEQDAQQSDRLYVASHRALESVLEHIASDAKLRTSAGARDLQVLIRNRYEQVVSILENDPRHDRLPLALAYDRLGKLYNDDDKTDTALDDYERSSRIYVALAAEANSPERTAEVRRHLGLSFTQQGNLLYDLGRLEESENAYRKAFQELTLAGRAAESSLGGADGQATKDVLLKSIAEVDHGLGVLLLAEGKRKESLEEFDRALRIRLDLVNRNGNEKSFNRDLARSYGYLGDVQLELGSVGDAEASYWRSHEIRSRFFNPQGVTVDDVEAAFQYARSLANFGNYHLRLRNFGTAHHFFNQTEVVQKDVVLKDPNNNDYSSDLAGTRVRLAEVCMLQGTLNDLAIEELRLATKSFIELTHRDPKNVSLSASLAESCLLTAVLQIDGNNTRAAAIANILDAVKYLEMPIKFRPQADYKYLLASAEALYAESLGRSFRPDAIWFKSLKEALEQGYCRKDRNDVANDRVFRNYKDRPEFRALLKLDARGETGTVNHEKH